MGEQAKEACCHLAADCVGFSWPNAHSIGIPSAGCFQKQKAGMTTARGYDGYEKRTACTEQDVKATTFVNFGKSAVIVVASWCGADANIPLSIDWPALGPDAATVHV